MSLSLRAVDWNRQKRLYDLSLGALLTLTLGAYLGVTAAVSPESTAETLLLRGAAGASLVLLHVILAIGPLARLDPRFLPLLYNRRHLGVTMAALATLHAGLAVFQFHALGDANPWWSVLTAYASDVRWAWPTGLNLAHLPFEPFGAAAWCVLALMAATSHDFWLRRLGAPVWKALHCGVYLAYALLLAHVAFGFLQSERSAVFPVALGAGWLGLTLLHLAAAAREARLDRSAARAREDGLDRVATCAEVPEGEGKVVVADGRRVALFRRAGRIYALANVCRHQGGPLGEGRIVDGCATCPWHGWNYRLEDGCSPPPFTELVSTHRLRRLGEDLWLDPKPSPPGEVHPGVPVAS